jgi:CBS domain-containing protein
VTGALTVSDLMHKPAVVVRDDISLSEASKVLDEHKVGAAAVLDGRDQLVTCSARWVTASTPRARASPR